MSREMQESYYKATDKVNHNLVVGQEWSKFDSHIKLVKLLKLSYDNDILSIWKCSETGCYFGNYRMSGIRAITDRLAKYLIGCTCLHYSKNHNRILKVDM